MYSQLSRCRAAIGSDFRLSLGGPTKVKDNKPFLFNEVSLKAEINNTYIL